MEEHSFFEADQSLEDEGEEISTLLLRVNITHLCASMTAGRILLLAYGQKKRSGEYTCLVVETSQDQEDLGAMSEVFSLSKISLAHEATIRKHSFFQIADELWGIDPTLLANAILNNRPKFGLN